MILLADLWSRSAALAAKVSRRCVVTLLGCRARAYHLPLAGARGAYRGFIVRLRGVMCHSRHSDSFVRVPLFCCRDRIRASRRSTP
jgi:hypothetical protein